MQTIHNSHVQWLWWAEPLLRTKIPWRPPLRFARVTTSGAALRQALSTRCSNKLCFPAAGNIAVVYYAYTPKSVFRVLLTNCTRTRQWEIMHNNKFKKSNIKGDTNTAAEKSDDSVTVSKSKSIVLWVCVCHCAMCNFDRVPHPTTSFDVQEQTLESSPQSPSRSYGHHQQGDTLQTFRWEYRGAVRDWSLVTVESLSKKPNGTRAPEKCRQYLWERLRTDNTDSLTTYEEYDKPIISTYPH